MAKCLLGHALGTHLHCYALCWRAPGAANHDADIGLAFWHHHARALLLYDEGLAYRPALP